MAYTVRQTEEKDRSITSFYTVVEGLQGQNGRSYLELFCGGKFLIPEQMEKLLLGTDLVRLVLIRASTKGRNEVLELPLLDVVVLCVPSVDIALDGVALVANHKSSSKLE